jgi:hypothetical protein
MIMYVLVNWGVLEALYIQNEEDFLLDGEEQSLVQVFSLLFRVQVFLRLSKDTCALVSVSC